MKSLRLLSCLLVIVLAGCSEDDVAPVGATSPQTKAITFQGGMDDVGVLIFNKSGDDYTYKQRISTGWSSEGRVTVEMQADTYKCLFYKYGGQNIDIYPSTLNNSVLFEDIEFRAKDDPANEDTHVLAVDEIWLPESTTMANQDYTVPDITEISNTLTRAVSQVIVHIRQISENENAEPSTIPLFEGTEMAIGNLSLTIGGVGRTIGVNGPIGNAITAFSTTTALEKEDGTYTFVGPYVFPSGSGANASVAISYTSNDELVLPSVTRTVEGALERNKRLEITLFIRESSEEGEFIDITVNTSEMEGDIPGDSGIWE